MKFLKQEPAAGAEIYGVLFDKIHESREIILETHEFRKIEFETHEKKLTLAIATPDRCLECNRLTILTAHCLNKCYVFFQYRGFWWDPRA